VHPDTPVITGIQLVQGSNFYGYTTEGPKTFLKIFVCSPRLFNSCKNGLYLLDQLMDDLLGPQQRQQSEPTRAFETNIDFEISF
jgi:hypothetical protein